MTPELYVLALAALLQAVQLALFAIPANLELGTRTLLAPRDEGNDALRAQLSTVPARLARAYDNHFEALAFFTVAVVVVTLSGASTPFTAICANVYLLARIFYVPAYAGGLFGVRSAIWTVGFLATLAMILAALFAGAPAA